MTNPLPRIGNIKSIEATGLRMGTACANDIAATPAIAAEIIRSIYLTNARKVFEEFSGDVPPNGKAAFRRGFERGMRATS